MSFYMESRNKIIAILWLLSLSSIAAAAIYQKFASVQPISLTFASAKKNKTDTDNH